MVQHGAQCVGNSPQTLTEEWPSSGGMTIKVTILVTFQTVQLVRPEPYFAGYAGGTAHGSQGTVTAPLTCELQAVQRTRRTVFFQIQSANDLTILMVRCLRFICQC